jgi:hypothetical protein
MSSDERVTMDDLIILGNAAPDELSDFRKSVCTAAYSPTHGLVRIYPVPPNAKLYRWYRATIPLQRNNQDVREESWKIQGSKDEWPTLHKKIRIGEQLKRKEWIALIDQLNTEFGVNCVQELNEQRLSLGLIKPKEMKPYFKKRENFDNTMQGTLFGGEPFMTIHNYALQPRLEYTCQDCKLERGYHDQQVISWEVYEWMRNNEKEAEKVWENLHIGDPQYHQSLLVGNQARHLTSFMVISVFRYKMA